MYNDQFFFGVPGTLGWEINANAKGCDESLHLDAQDSPHVVRNCPMTPPSRKIWGLSFRS